MLSIIDVCLGEVKAKKLEGSIWWTIQRIMDQCPDDKDKELMEITNMTKAAMLAEIREIKEDLENAYKNLPLVFCHNDLLPANFIYKEVLSLVFS